MKKVYILLAVLSMAALASCQQNEIDGGDTYIAQKGDIAFSMARNGGATRSSVSKAAVKGMTIDLGTQDGTHFVLEESVANLDFVDYGPVTRGTPAFTENLGQLYESMGVYADGGNFGGDFSCGEIEKSGDSWIYRCNFSSNPWPENDAEVGLYFRMPASATGVTLGTNPYAEGAITFSYVSPESAANMQDILFGYRTAKESDAQGVIPVLLNHALSGVKFAIGNTDADITTNSITITEVVFEGLYDTGTCTITPAALGSDAGSSATAVDWGTPENTPNKKLSSGSFVKGTTQSIADYSKSDYYFPDSFTSAAATHNLNDDNATQTFWLIPQAFADRTGVTMTIKYTFNGNPYEWPIDLGKTLGGRGVEWKAGELRTFTLKIDEVNVQIEDTVEPVNNVLTKKDVEITNTGNVEVFIRAALVGQWLDRATDNIVFGFTDAIGNLYVVESWYEDQFVTKNKVHGEFVGLAGYDKADGHNNWVVGDDGFYYYTQSVAPGQKTNQLFEKYFIKSTPEAISIAGEVMSGADIYFRLEISTQAISARTSNGTLITDYAAAWAAAENGEKPTVTTPPATTE